MDTVLSLGAGVQSTTLLLMALRGKWQLQAAVFADTQWEPQSVYAHLDWLEARCREAGMPLHRVTRGDLRAQTMRGPGSVEIPAHFRTPDGRHALLKRQCTRDYKVAPVRRALRALGYGPRRPVQLALGISLDEWHRVRDSDVRWVTHVYPLVDWRLTRADCVGWLRRHGYPIPPKSSCLGCPLHNDAYWQRLRRESPAEFAATVAVDHAVRHRAAPRYGGAYLYRSCRPLEEAIADSAGQEQLTFDDECAGGWCFV